MRNVLLLFTLTLIFILEVSSQEPTVLTVGKQETFRISPNGEKKFSVHLKRGEFADVFALASADLGLVASVYSAEGEKLLENEDASQSVPFIATTDGEYVIVFSSKPWDENQSPQAANQLVTVTYTNSFKPHKSALKASKKLNGYDLKILAEVGDSGSTYFLVSKGPKLHGILKRPNAPYGGFYFKDDVRKAYTPAQKRSATLFGSTLDKTGNGVPDVAVEYYSGGAHCCFEITFFELGDEVRQIGPIETANDSLTATKKKVTGGLQFVASEQAFAYWAISFAGSPMPLVIFDIKDGVLTPNFELMKKPAPSLRTLQQKAEAARLKMNTNSYSDPIENFNDFEEAFWSEMLDLIYAGHEDLAWQYFDLVWPAAKPGKAKFLSDFREQLSKSYWGEAYPQKVFGRSN